MRRLYQRVRAFLGPKLARARDLFPLTLLGLLVAGGGALAMFVYGIGRLDLVLLVLGIVALGLAAISLVLTSATAIVLYFRLRRREAGPALSMECGYPRRTGYVVGSPWFLPFVRVGWGWLAPDVEVRLHRRGLRVEEEVVAIQRTLRDHLVRRFEIGDTFGLSRIAFSIREDRPVRAAPSIGALKNVQVLRSMAAGEELSHPAGPAAGERADMRQYVPGDPIRYILWKVFARAREVVVRTPERAIGPTHQTVAYLVTGASDEPAAGAARVAVESGALGADWVLGADGCDAYAESSAAALELLARSGESPEPAGGTGLPDFLSRATPGGMGRAIVFVPGSPGPWLDRFTKSLSKVKGSVLEIVVCTDGIDRQAKEKKRLGERFLRAEGASGAEPRDPKKGIGLTKAAEVNEVSRRLASVGARVTIVDRVRGAAWSSAQSYGRTA